MKRILSVSFLALVPLVFSATTGCMKAPDDQPDYGPEIPISAISEAISSDAPMDLSRIKNGQYVSIDDSQVINTQIPSVIGQRLDEITGFSDLPTYVSVDFRVTLREYVDGSWKESVQPFSLAIGKAEEATGKAEEATVTAQKFFSYSDVERSAAHVSIQSLKKMDSVSAQKVTYHNLKREIGRIPVPEAVKAHPNCGGVLNCAAGLRYLRVSFDRVIWESDKSGIKTAFKITYSPDIPPYIHDWDNTNELYFTNQLQTCAQTWFEITQDGQTQTVPVLQCLDVRDFKFGI